MLIGLYLFLSVLSIDSSISDMSASLNSVANVPFLTQSLNIYVKIGAKIPALSLSIAILIPVVVFFGSSFFTSEVTSSVSTNLNSNKVQNLLSLITMILG